MPHPVPNRPLRNLLSRLLTRRVDAVLETNVVAEASLRASGLEQRVRAAGSPIRSQDRLFIACTPNNPKTAALMNTLERGYEVLRGDGRLAAILDRYKIKAD